MLNTKLQQAIDGLRISDVYVRKIMAQCSDEFDPKYAPLDNSALQTKHLVRRSEVVEVETGEELFRVHLAMGVRWVDESVPDDGFQAVVEADFVAEYTIVNDLEQESLDEFALRNASYHVWPYWRELLTSQCDRMRLPRVVLPAVQFPSHQQSESGPPPVGSDDETGAALP